jgi:hypothetical protein
VVNRREQWWERNLVSGCEEQDNFIANVCHCCGGRFPLRAQTSFLEISISSILTGRGIRIG